MRQQFFGMVLAAAAVFCLSGMGYGATLQQSTSLTNLSASIPLRGDADSVQDIVKAAVSGSWTNYWDFGDKNGDGNRDDAVTPMGLSMGNKNLTAETTDIRLNLDNGNIDSDGGIIKAASSDSSSGDIEIENVANISMGDGYIQTQTELSGSRRAGRITINQMSGDIQVAMIKADGQQRGEIIIYGAGDVIVTNASGVAGDLVNGGHKYAGFQNIKVRHNGSFRAATAGNSRYDSRDSNDIIEDNLFDGWYSETGDPQGTFQVSNLVSQAYQSYTDRNRTVPSDPIVVRNYDTVQVAGNIETRTTSTNYNNGDAGDITITNIINDITISGTVDASADKEYTGNELSKRGILTLQAGGTITLGSLNLANIQYAVLNPGARSLITGLITGADGSNPLAGDGVGTLSNAGTAMLRVPAGKDVRYYMDQNPDLQGGIYKLADENGSVGDGGTLEPYQPQGTVVVVQ